MKVIISEVGLSSELDSECFCKRKIEWFMAGFGSSALQVPSHSSIPVAETSMNPI